MSAPDQTRSVVSIHVGQCGVQMGSKIWELMAYEHDISLDGAKEFEENDFGKPHAFFIETLSGKFVPKCLMLDTEPNVIDNLQCLSTAALFNEQYTCFGNEDACGVYTLAKNQFEEGLSTRFQQTLRILLEQCDITVGCMTYSAIGAGTGSHGGLIAQQLYKEQSPKTTNLWTTLFPSDSISNSPVEAINCAFAMSDPIAEANDLQVNVSNDALYSLAKKSMPNVDVNYSHLNSLVARVVSCVTSSLRFSSELSVDLNDLFTSLVPKKQFKYVYPMFAPGESSNTNYRLALSDITNEIFEGRGNLYGIKIKSAPANARDANRSRYISLCMLFRGDVQPSLVYPSVQAATATRKDHFVEYMPSSYTVGINTDMLLTPDTWQFSDPCRACCSIIHNTGFAINLDYVSKKLEKIIGMEAYNWNFDPFEKNLLPDAYDFMKQLSEEYVENFE